MARFKGGFETQRFNESNNYRGYLLRLSRTADDEPWQIVAKDIETGEEFPFVNLGALFEFLTERVPDIPRA
jgi:hypothetical protein